MDRTGEPSPFGLSGLILLGDGERATLTASAIVVGNPALRGQEHMKPVGNGIYRIVFPTVVAARERVSQNQKFRFDHLASGRYVIRAQYAGGNAITSLDVSAVAGQVATVDLPNTCM
jgi:hypothetical protein